MSYGPSNRNRGVRAQARRESIERSVSGRRVIAEAKREQALRDSEPLPSGLWQRLLGALRRRGA